MFRGAGRIEVFPAQPGGASGQPAERSLDVVLFALRVSLKGADLNFDGRRTVAVEGQRAEVVRVAAEVEVVRRHPAEHLRRGVPEQYDRLIHRMRAGVEEIPGALVLPGLPVPAAAVAGPVAADADDPAQHPRSDHFADFAEVRIEAGILEGEEKLVRFFGGCRDRVEFGHCGRGGFLAEHMESRLQSGERGFDVETARRRVDQQFEAACGDQLLCVMECFAAESLDCVFPPVVQFVGHRDDLESRISLQVPGVDVAAAAAETGDGCFHFPVHVVFSLNNLSIRIPEFGINQQSRFGVRRTV